MKKIQFSIILAVALILSRFSFSQDEMIILNSKEFGDHKRPVVSFPHERHSTQMACGLCHHDYDIFKTNLNDEGRKCGDCHSIKQGKNRVPLKRAFHMQCKGCHERMRERGKMDTPVMCGQCHHK